MVFADAEFGQAFGQALGMWMVFAIIVLALVLYAVDRIPMALSSLAIIALLLALFQFFPIIDASGDNLLGPTPLLKGFANPALVAIIALLVIGEGLSRTGVLDRAAGFIFELGRGSRAIAPILTLVFVLAISGFLNNTPVVVIFIPIVQVLARQLDVPASRWMMSLSFASILGGMITLIGSSTNLLVSGLLEELGEPGFSFFDFTIPGLVMAATGFVYVAIVAPRLTPVRRRPDFDQTTGGRQFVAQITVAQGSKFEGLAPRGGFFPDLKDLTVKAVRRNGKSVPPPFDDDLILAKDDRLIVAATRKALTAI